MFLALWACTLSPTVLAAFAIYGPEPFVQIPGPAQTRTILFDASVPGPGYTLLLHNGDADSSPTTRANRAEVWLNGEQLVGRGNFLPITRDLEIPVVLATTNELSVLVKGGVGRYLTLEILSLPVADAGPDQAVAAGDLVTLDAGGSWDLGGGPLFYSWELIAQPTDSTAILSDAGSIRPTLEIDRPGDYRAHLSVSDGSYESEPDQIPVSTFNTPPQADAGPDQSLPVGAVAYLDASGSQDAEGDLLGFVWTLASAPAGSGTVLGHEPAHDVNTGAQQGPETSNVLGECRDNHDIRAARTPLGHKKVKTAMIYKYVLERGAIGDQEPVGTIGGGVGYRKGRGGGL